MSDVLQPPVGTGLVSAIAAIAVIVRLAYRELRERRVRISRLFAVPAVVTALAAFLIFVAVSTAPQAAPVLALATFAGIAIGGVAGFGSAHFTHLRIAAGEPGFIYTKGSYVTLSIWIGALGLRVASRFIVGGDLAHATIANAAVLSLLAASISVLRYRIFTRAQGALASGDASDLAALS